MSDASQGPGWWIASDGRWYPPENLPLPAFRSQAPRSPGPPGSWLASNGQWYQPEMHPSAPAQITIHQQLTAPLSGQSTRPGSGNEEIPTLGSGSRRPPSRFALAGWFVRFGGRLIDAIIVFFLLFLLLVIIGAKINVGPLFLYWEFIGVEFIYGALFIGSFGATPGMRWLGLRGSNAADGTYPVGVMKGSIRAGSALVIAIFPFGWLVDYLWPIWDRRNQTLHDKLARTVVLGNR